VVHTDDTGWRVGGEPAFLTPFETDTATVYQVRPRHRHEAVQEVIPADYGDVVVTDPGCSYNAQVFDDVQQQKCLAHVLLSISSVVETKTGRARDFGDQLKALLQDAPELWRAHRDAQAMNFKAEAEALQAELTYQLRDRRLQDLDNERLLNELGWHHDRGHVLRFLVDPRIEPTNNGVASALCPAAIARQMSHCSKNGRGAHAFAAFTSVVRTLAKRGVNTLVEDLYHLCQPPNLQSVAP
jgi:transposase